MNLQFGLGHAVPKAVEAAWGARLIFPADLLPDRQDLVAVPNSQDKADLVWWLNGKVRGQGAISAALKVARKAKEEGFITSRGAEQVILYQDVQGVIVACPNNSCGYLYVAGWLHWSEKGRMPSAEYKPLVFLTQKEKDAKRKAAQLEWQKSPIGQIIAAQEQRARDLRAARKKSRAVNGAR